MKKNTKIYSTISVNELQTIFFGQKLTKKCLSSKNKHIIFLLTGPLGAGKTQLVKGVAKTIGINPKKINSPTFIFITQHNGKKCILYHMDFYRIEKKFLSEILLDHIKEIQLYKKNKTITCIEWANKIDQKKYYYFFKTHTDVDFYTIDIKILNNKSRKIVVKKNENKKYL